MGTKRPRAKTKSVLKPVNKMKQLAGKPKTKKLKNLNKNHPTVLGAPHHQFKEPTIYLISQRPTLILCGNLFLVTASNLI